MTLKVRRKIELLAPAGGPGTALAAFDAGADAVYVGLDKFNARERTENFSFDDLSRLMAYAGKIGRKVYVTFNTLLKESELPEAAEYLSRLEELRPDAVIVQDSGVARLIRRYFPSLCLHGSTQMGIHNSAGVAWAASAGFRRVILERQVTLAELRAIVAATSVELEVFVHGALCCSLSGTCLFSSWLGGWSGNRGKCKQPCRRWYGAAGTEGYLFSPADLCLLEQLPLLRELGVTSLKIEGRLKKADYVRSVVGAYRMVLDAEHPTPEVLTKASRILNNTAGRSCSEGFARREDFDRLIRPGAPGIWGFPVGRIRERRRDGIVIAAERRFHLGDRLRLLPPRAEDGPVVTVTAIRVHGAEVTKAGRGEICFLPCDTTELPFPAVAYKIGECARSNDNRAAALPPARTAADLAIAITADHLAVTVTNLTAPRTWTCPLTPTPARKHPLSAATVAEAFAATCSDTLAAGTMTIHLAGEWFVPASILKQCRREFWHWATAEIPSSALQAGDGSGLYGFWQDYRAAATTPPTDAAVTAAVGPDGRRPEMPFDHLAVPLGRERELSGSDEVILPSFCPEARLPEVRRAIQHAYDCGCRRFRVTSFYGLPLLRKYHDLIITVSFPLPVANSLAAAEMHDYGVARVQGWVELERGELEHLLAHTPLPVEIYRRGRPVLLATRAGISATGEIHDQRNNRFIIRRERDGITRLYPREIMSVPGLSGAAAFYDLTGPESDSAAETTFNFNGSWF
ncbi:MAG: DUF3656 domain-containing protein [Victivallales bacterium]|nr:DUF3656 domain-containing protein [Victivallales bacterium]